MQDAVHKTMVRTGKVAMTPRRLRHRCRLAYACTHATSAAQNHKIERPRSVHHQVHTGRAFMARTQPAQH